MPKLFNFRLLAVLVFTLLFSQAKAQDPVLDTNMWVADASTNVIARSGNTIYVGGFFKRIGPNTGRGGIFSTQNDELVNSLLKIDGNVSVSTPDGNGGWYIAGNFTNVAGVSRNRLAHILPNYTVDPNWIPQSNDAIHAMIVEGNTVYLGGFFTQINGQTRNRIAALDGSTGQLLPWNPNSNGKVSTFKVLGNKILVGGDFNTIGGQTRNRLAALDLTTGQATAWNPNVNTEVRTIDVNGGIVYFGGSFSSVNSQPRSRIAAVDTNTGQLLSWNPNVNSEVYMLKYVNNSIYVAGNFTMIGTQARNRLAIIDVPTATATSFNPNCDGVVLSFAIVNNKLFFGGSFTTVGNIAREGLASIDLATETINSWNPNSNGSVFTISLSGSGLFVGGSFLTLGGVVRNRIAAIDATTGRPTAWNPNADAPVSAISIVGNIAYIGGQFNNIGGQSRNNLAAIDLATGQATSWNPNPNNIVRNIDVAGNIVYIVGEFTNIGGQIRNRIAAIEASTGLPTTWNPNADNTVSMVVSKGDTIYVSGAFTSIGGQNRNSVAALDSTTGLATSWNPNPPSGGVNAIGVIGNIVYLGGTFSSIGGQPRNRIAAVSATTGLATNWNPNSAGNIFALTVKGNTIYAGGTFTTIGGQPRNRLAAIDATTGQVSSWNPNANGSIFWLHVDDYAIHVTGGFTNIGSISNRGFAIFNLPPCTPTPTITAGGPTTFCSGGSVTLTAPTGFSYLWSNNETTRSINVTTGGSYTVRTIDNGCTSSVSLATVVTVNTCGSTWVGGNSTAWNNASNWSNNQVPGATTDITVPAGTANTLNLNGSFMCRNITLDAGATINLGANALMVKGNANLSGTITGNGGIISLNGTTAQTLTGSNANVYRLEVANPQGCTFTGTINITDGLYLKQGVINNNNGTFTLKSSSTGTAFLDNFSSGFTGSLAAGIQVERYSTGAYRHVGAPLAGQTINALNVSCLLVRTFDEPSNSWMPIGSNCELQEFDNLGGISFNAGTASNNPTTVTFIGFPVSGGISFPLVRTTSVAGGPQTGWNSLYNPYASPIDWNVIKNFGTNGSITNRAVWIWNSNINNWATLTGLGIAANGASSIIASGQGILVRRLTNGFTGNNFTMDNTCRLGLNTTQFLRSANPTNQETIRFTLSNESQKDETVIHLTNLSSQELDENDAERPQSLSNGIELSTLSKSGEKLMVNATSASDLKEIPLSIKTSKSGTYTLSLTENLSNLNIQILDLKTGKLTPAENGLTITASENEEISSRYKLIFNNKKTDVTNTFTAWAINTSEIQVASVNENLNNLEVFNAVGQKLDFTSQLKGEGQATIKLSNPTSGILFIRSGNATERVVMSR